MIEKNTCQACGYKWDSTEINGTRVCAECGSDRCFRESAYPAEVELDPAVMTFRNVLALGVTSSDRWTFDIFGADVLAAFSKQYRDGVAEHVAVIEETFRTHKDGREPASGAALLAFVQKLTGSKPNPLLAMGIRDVAFKLTRANATDTTENTTTEKKSKYVRPITAAAVDCGRIYKQDKKAGRKPTKKAVVEDYVAKNGGSWTTIERTMTDHPDLWKDDN